MTYAIHPTSGLAAFEEPDHPRRAPMLRYQLTLPFPPSVNDIWQFTRRRVSRSAAYMAWIKEVDGCVLEQAGIRAYRRTIQGKYRLLLELDLHRFSAVDQDNCIKAVSDTLQRNRLIANDKFAWQTNVVWTEFETSHDGRPLCRVTVEEVRA